MALNVLIIVSSIFLIHCVQTLKSVDVNRKSLTDWDILWIKCEEIFFHLSPYYCEINWFRWISLDKCVDQKDEAFPVATQQLLSNIDHTDIQTLSHFSMAGNLGKISMETGKVCIFVQISNSYLVKSSLGHSAYSVFFFL